jgi:hypothetical protein
MYLPSRRRATKYKSNNISASSIYLLVLFLVAFINTLLIYSVVPTPAPVWRHQRDDGSALPLPSHHHLHLKDDGHNMDHNPTDATGSFANCSRPVNSSHSTPVHVPLHLDEQVITISCHTLAYRVAPVPKSSIEPIILGVLSEATGEGPSRRHAIRTTWGNGHTVYFIVAGRFGDIEQEYNQYGDLIWLDQPEVYRGETSVLTFKTLAFLQIVRDLFPRVSYAFKTDDDCFVNVMLLYQHLLPSTNDNTLHLRQLQQQQQKNHRKYEINYWGKCKLEYIKPLRNTKFKWGVSLEMYPEPYYPIYCQGVGFAVSYKFLSCAAATNDNGSQQNGHIANMRFMPFEDVAVGLLAERCGMNATSVKSSQLIKQYRTNIRDERFRIKNGMKKIDMEKLPMPDMVGRIVVGYYHLLPVCCLLTSLFIRKKNHYYSHLISSLIRLKSNTAFMTLGT